MLELSSKYVGAAPNTAELLKGGICLEPRSSYRGLKTGANSRLCRGPLLQGWGAAAQWIGCGGAGLLGWSSGCSGLSLDLAV